MKNIVAFVPARGGSKSIPLKNLVLLAGVPLLDYGIRAVQASGRATRIVCSTDDDRIATRALELGIDVDKRPEHLGGDETPVTEVVREYLTRAEGADLLILVQPTSPFLLPEHVSALIDMMSGTPEARSGQTVAPCPHNHHAWNQREIINGRVRFKFPLERATAYNKQRKPKLYVSGNLIAVRPSAVLNGEGMFAEPSVAIEIQAPYDFDLDGPSDIVFADCLLRSGVVRLPHMPVPVVPAVHN